MEMINVMKRCYNKALSGEKKEKDGKLRRIDERMGRIKRSRMYDVMIGSKLKCMKLHEPLT